MYSKWGEKKNPGKSFNSLAHSVHQSTIKRRKKIRRKTTMNNQITRKIGNGEGRKKRNREQEKKTMLRTT